MSKFGLITVGKTHSGKSTFGNQLSERIDNSVVLDTDTLEVFLKENYSRVHLSSINREKKDWDDPRLKYQIFNTLLEFVMANGFIPLLTNANISKDSRARLIEKLRAEGLKVILVYFNLPDETLLKRIEDNGKSTEILNTSKSFQELLTKKQNVRVDSPTANEADYFFEINSGKDSDAVIDEVVKIITNS